MNEVNVSADGTIEFVTSPNPRITSHIQSVSPFYFLLCFSPALALFYFILFI